MDSNYLQLIEMGGRQKKRAWWPEIIDLPQPERLARGYLAPRANAGLDMLADLLVHIDGSETGRRRLQLSIGLARSTGARLTGLHVTPAPDVEPLYKPSQLDGAVADLARKLAEDDLLVMGGYSHPMWLEFIFGGTTKSAVRSSKTPILVSH